MKTLGNWGKTNGNEVFDRPNTIHEFVIASDLTSDVTLEFARELELFSGQII